MKRAIRTIGENVTIYDDGITAVVGSVCVLELVSQQRLSPPVTGGLPSGFQLALLVFPAH